MVLDDQLVSILTLGSAHLSGVVQMHLLLAAAPPVSLSLETDERVHCLVTLDDHSCTLQNFSAFLTLVTVSSSSPSDTR